MKKILLAIAIASASLVTFSSCTKEYYETAPAKTYLFDVKPSDWSKTTSSSKTYSIILSTPAIDNIVAEEGVVNVAISYDSDPDFYEIIPAKIANYHFSGNYAANPGEVTIYAEDINITPQAPDALRVKISISEGLVVN